MSVFPRLSIPPHRSSPGAPSPKYLALVIGINYASSGDDASSSDPGLQLHGPVNDAKDIKKMLQEHYRYRGKDIVLMTDEGENRDTGLWPSRANILRAIDNLVRGACPGDNFVFYYAGHCGQETLEIDGVEVKHQFIITRDGEKIHENTLHARLVVPLPPRSRLIAISDACHSSDLFALSYYRCHNFLRSRSESQTLRRRRATRSSLRRNTEPPGSLQPWTSAAFGHLRTFSGVATITLAIIRLKSLREKRSRKGKAKAAPPTPTVPPATCKLCNSTHDMSDAPIVIALSPCGEDQRTYEDSKRMGKGMTVKLTKTLRKNPSINLGGLNRQLNWCLAKLAFKRVKMATREFRKLAGKVSPQREMKLKKKYEAEGLFDFGDQKALFGSLQPLRAEDQFIIVRVPD